MRRRQALNQTSCSWRLSTMAGALFVGALVASSSAYAGDLPVTGVPVPSLADFDALMLQFMDDVDLEGGVLAVSRNDRVVYQRGFGWLRDGIEMPENTTFRVASVEKPITAAAIRMLIADGLLDWGDFVFDLGQQPDGGILPHDPWTTLGDARLADITIRHLVDHVGGWDRERSNVGDSGDPQFESIHIADEMEVPWPAGRDNTIRYMLSQPLEFTPGTLGCTDDDGNPALCYSNFGYMLLGRIVEEITGLSHAEFVRRRVLTPDMWVPATDLLRGRTFPQNQSLREPAYRGGGVCTNVFDGGLTPCVYGGWNHEAFAGHGNLVVSAAPLLAFMDRYQVSVGGNSGAPLNGGNGGGIHVGSIKGANAVTWQRGDGLNIVVLFNERKPDEDDEVAYTMAKIISDRIDAGGISWPTRAVDGFWIDFALPGPGGYGDYELPWNDMNIALGRLVDGSKVNVKPGSTSWTGTIDRRIRLSAPFGTAIIGS